MEHILVNELHLHENKEITDFYLAVEKDLREGKGGPYLRLKLQDRSGQVSANVWKDATKTAGEFDAGDVVKIRAQVVNYKGQIQLSITQLRFADKSEYDISSFVARSRFEPEFLAERFWEFVDKVENEYLNRLLHTIFDDKDFFARFMEAPAAKSWHHNYMSGLIEHTIAVASLCEFVSTRYAVSQDLLITGAILHDVGKVIEYNSKIAIDFTDEGRLLGHLSISDQMAVEAAAKIPGFPEDLLLNIRHLILAHHGEYEKASVRLPQTLEALILHHCDNLDAQAAGVSQLLDAAPPDATWSEYDRINNRYYRFVRI
ncbi:MAG: HD domain-containing protein [Candidatus Cloacimonadaceae bacterium]|jgi:3'-5' exoribonuclease|nr:HD domain-containing protein [Candidatus Cloacimonadota bacterium]MDY0128153.1 HD domain-containing protein [Candidatus Cloacimonadaceae bacterium]MCB5254438.1 HD domain-containing protein [Candidatus Cloacimonadota bacterium]MCK9178417.1 HD domain-containing protein [Candidatus Cloacimonadota bacterium]MCK9242494.1 HD domain-containing protein [Candidatus Cloacimonadota bacterium]